jgi:creatinine amidohydrolase
LGSSQAAARLLLVELGRRHGSGGVYRTTAEFFRRRQCPEEALLFVFSQGISPNAQIALAHAKDFAGVVLVTSVGATATGDWDPPDSIRPNASRPERLELVERLEAEGAMVVRHPMESEYTILPRVIGPVCAAVAAIKLASAFTRSPMVVPDALLPSLEHPCKPPGGKLSDWAKEWVDGVDFNFTNDGAEYAQNLAAKAMEALFIRPPACRDVFEYSHGPFQLNETAARSQWVFSGPTAAEKDLRLRLRPLFERAPSAREIVAPYGPPWDLFYFEVLLNSVLIEAVRQLGLDLVDWPGKGLDGAGYEISKPHIAGFSG